MASFNKPRLTPEIFYLETTAVSLLGALTFFAPKAQPGFYDANNLMEEGVFKYSCRIHYRSVSKNNHIFRRFNIAVTPRNWICDIVDVSRLSRAWVTCFLSAPQSCTWEEKQGNSDASALVVVKPGAHCCNHLEKIRHLRRSSGSLLLIRSHKTHLFGVASEVFV